jgi:mono/diheme cytochrome c family protein
MRREVMSRVVPVAVLLGMLAATAKSAEEAGPEWKAPARAAKKKNPIPADDKSIALGKQVYEKECVSCHGKTGKGDGPKAADLERKPGDLSSPHVQSQSDGELFWKVSEGRKPMPSGEKLLNEEERWQVVDYMRSLASTTNGGIR